MNRLFLCASVVVVLSVLSQGQEECRCTNERPPNTEYTCLKQAEWGKCSRSYMEGYCEASCGKCDCPCVDVPPADGGATCEERASWGACEKVWMIDGYYCAKSCGFCGDGGVAASAAATVKTVNSKPAPEPVLTTPAAVDKITTDPVVTPVAVEKVTTIPVATPTPSPLGVVSVPIPTTTPAATTPVAATPTPVVAAVSVPIPTTTPIVAPEPVVAVPATVVTPTPAVLPIDLLDLTEPAPEVETAGAIVDPTLPFDPTAPGATSAATTVAATTVPAAIVSVPAPVPTPAPLVRPVTAAPVVTTPVPAEKCKTVYEIMSEDPDLSTSFEIWSKTRDMKATGYDDETTPFTIFVPTNDAWTNYTFEKFTTLPELLMDEPLLDRLVQFHEMPEPTLTTDWRHGLNLRSELRDIYNKRIIVLVSMPNGLTGDIRLLAETQALIIERDIEACAAVLMKMKDVMVPSGSRLGALTPQTVIN